MGHLHNFRKTTATHLDQAGLSARVIADQLGHARPSMTQDVYMGRKAVDARVDVFALTLSPVDKEVRSLTSLPARTRSANSP